MDGITGVEKEFLKIVCVDESDPLEYKILEDANRSSLQEVHEFISSRYDKHKGARWIMYPCSCSCHVN